MVVYLPIALVKDWFCSFWFPKNLYSSSSAIGSSFGLNFPLRVNDMPDDLESDLRCCLLTDKDLDEKEEWPLNVKNEEDEPNFLQQNSELSSWEISKWSLYLAPIWFITEHLQIQVLQAPPF